MVIALFLRLLLMILLGLAGGKWALLRTTWCLFKPYLSPPCTCSSSVLAWARQWVFSSDRG